VEALVRGGLPIVEMTMTVPKAVTLMTDLIREVPSVMIGAGDIVDSKGAEKCLDAGAAFLTGPSMTTKVIEFAAKHNVLVLPGALTPTEVVTAWQAGADMVKVFPVAQVGGYRYIGALTRPFPQIPLIAAGGIGQSTASKYIRSGATAIGVGAALIPREAFNQHERDWIPELARRFTDFVTEARKLPRL
jgi:2-dehydro-3-deoxyphosphogluconate aldolase/(4S)-4-hydroxy-2-oxoglutarate aldolase